MRIYRQSDLRNLALPRYLIPDYLIENSLAQLCGPSGGGKTFVYTDWACRLACQGRRVLIILGEGLHRYQTRLDAWQQHHGLTVPDNNLIVVADVPSLPDHSQMAELVKETKKITATGQIAMITVDTFAKAMAGYDEQVAADVTVGLVNLTSLRYAALGAAGLLVTHFGWSNERQRGSSALYGECDTVLYLKKVSRRAKKAEAEEEGEDDLGYLLVEDEPKSKRVALTIDKQRDGPDDIPTLTLERTDVDLGYEDGDGRPVTSCVYLPVKPERKPKASTNGHGKVVDLRAASLSETRPNL